MAIDLCLCIQILNTGPSWVWTQVVYFSDNTKAGKWAVTLRETGLWKKMQPSENGQPARGKQASMSTMSEIVLA